MPGNNQGRGCTRESVLDIALCPCRACFPSPRVSKSAIGLPPLPLPFSPLCLTETAGSPAKGKLTNSATSRFATICSRSSLDTNGRWVFCHSLLPCFASSTRGEELCALALAASASQTSTIIGPALGDLLYTAGPATVCATASGLFLGASMLVASIRVARAPLLREPVSFQSLFAGIAFIRRRPAILGAISLDLFAVLLGGATALPPIYARDILGTGPWGLGLLRSAPACGALSMSVALAHHPLRRRVGQIMFSAVTLFGFATMVFAVSTTFLLSLATLVVLGAADVISVVIRNSLVQIETPDAMRAQVTAVHSMFIGTSNQLGEFEPGVTAALFGVVPAVLLGGVGTILVSLIWLRLFPELARIDSLGYA